MIPLGDLLPPPVLRQTFSLPRHPEEGRGGGLATNGRPERSAFSNQQSAFTPLQLITHHSPYPLACARGSDGSRPQAVHARSRSRASRAHSLEESIAR